MCARFKRFKGVSAVLSAALRFSFG
jgi:hypothetical protein